VSNGNVKTNQDFDNLSKQIAKATPVGVKMNAYNPTNTAAASCPKTTAGKWEAVSDPLPPAANAQLCSCMMDTLSCVVADKTSEDDFGDMFGFICGLKGGEYCAGINKNATSSRSYGAYGMCSNKEQLSFAANAYAKAVSGGCNFKGKATTKAAVATPTASGCSSLLKAAGASGTGVVSGGATGSSSGSASSGNKTGAASALSAPVFNAGAISLGMYVVGAAVSGMAMILL